MKITITIKNEWSGKTYDISLDNQQKIATTLRVMRENLPESMQGIGIEPEVQSERTSRRLNMRKTYLYRGYIDNFAGTGEIRRGID